MSIRSKRVKRVLAILGDAIRWATTHNQPARATKLRKGRRRIRNLFPVGFPTAPPTKPTPPPVVPTTPPAAHGFMPGAIVKNIVPGANDPAIIPCGVIQHIAVTEADTLIPGFTDGRGIESHFYVHKDGTIEQYRSIFFEADAQFAGNSFFLGGRRVGFISVEHQGGDGADLGVPMPKAQLDAFHRIILWVKSQADFPLRKCPAWNVPGVGYHAQFVEWNTNHHSCPGAARIAQFEKVTVPWMAAQ